MILLVISWLRQFLLKIKDNLHRFFRMLIRHYWISEITSLNSRPILLNPVRERSNVSNAWFFYNGVLKTCLNFKIRHKEIKNENFINELNSSRSPQGLRFSPKNKAPSRGCYFFGERGIRIMPWNLIPALIIKLVGFVLPTFLPSHHYRAAPQLLLSKS